MVSIFMHLELPQDIDEGLNREAQTKSKNRTTAE